MARSPIYVTESYLPPLEEYQRLIAQMWDQRQLTNHGPYVAELEEKLRQHLGVRHLLLVSNGTLAIQLAIKALDLKGEVITTPFSYVATVSSLVWEGCTPVFADISERDFCLSPEAIEAAITPRTVGILATHVYGFPCATERIRAIAEKHGLRVIYDAAHAFGVTVDGRSLLCSGDISTLSFHATKVFHTAEGGAVVCEDDGLARKLAYLRNFGHNGQEAFHGLGINAKMSEPHAAMGLCVLPKVAELIAGRKRASDRYDRLLQGAAGIYRFHVPANVGYNFAYYPVLLSSEEHLLRVRDALNTEEVFPRRYFYPALHTLPYLPKVGMPVSESVSRRMLCLPLHPFLPEADIVRIVSIIKANS